MLSLLHLLQEILRIKILDNATFQPFFNSRSERSHPLFLIFQKAKTGTNHFTGVIVTSAQYTGLNEFFEMRTKRN